MAYKIKFSKLYGKYQVYYGKGRDIKVLEEFKREASAKKWIKEQKEIEKGDY